jgi:VIT1/CCC1 family predicted Fe2+/Mn2+ transporter
MMLESNREATPPADASRQVRETEHDKDIGSKLRAAVLGANDGLVSNLCLIIGVAGTGAAPNIILLTGFAGLISGACSMALGEWLSVSNAREMAKHLIIQERKQVEDHPSVETHDLQTLLESKGLAVDEAGMVATHLLQASHQRAAEMLVSARFGIDPTELGGNPWAAGATSFALFTAGALIPLLPFLLLNGHPAMFTSILLSLVALGFTGWMTARFTGRSALFSVSRQVLVGSVAAAFTYSLGLLLGVTLH